MGKEMKQMQPAKEKLHTLYKIYEKPMLPHCLRHPAPHPANRRCRFRGILPGDRQSAQDRRSGESADQAVHDTDHPQHCHQPVPEKRPGIRPALSVGR